ncbi:PEP-CTERM sorting domain-containing protein [Massilia sp. LXY-6]|uniref:PEP-CTERM sorting domain-containing protein n=1 Tax=Massilia sp. LXY-6 TaxID=3379823 RepID=UPI003EE051EA
MAIRYFIAAALMASACAAHADVIPSNGGAGIINGSNVAGAVGDSSVIAGVNRGAGSDALVEALYQKVSASVGSDMKVSLKQGIDGVYVTGLSPAKAAALAGDGMSVIATTEGFKIVDTSGAKGAPGNGNAISGGGAAQGGNGNGNGNGTGTSGSGDANLNANTNPGSPSNGLGLGLDNGNGLGNGNGNANGVGNGNGNGIGLGTATEQATAAAVPEPSTVALMLAGMLGVAGLGRRRAR